MGSIGETDKLGQFANGFRRQASQSILGFMHQTYHVGISNLALNSTFIQCILNNQWWDKMKRVMSHLEEIAVTVKKLPTCDSWKSCDLSHKHLSLTVHTQAYSLFHG